MPQAVLDALPVTPAAADSPQPRRERRCPECNGALASVQPAQIFCSAAHKRAWNNRWYSRGGVLAPLAMAERITRGGSRGDKATGCRARRDAAQLLQRWKDEDAAAGRMSAVDYVALRYRLGLVDVVR